MINARLICIGTIFAFLWQSCQSSDQSQPANNSTPQPTVKQQTVRKKKPKKIVKSEDYSMIDTTTIFWYWEDEFSDVEKEKMRRWIMTVTEGTFASIGQYPFDVHYYFHQSLGNEPVPFGHTRRHHHQSVHFYVNTSFSLEDFLADWTAPHEISHLSICFVGKKNKWFSEGFATYLSRQIMVDMGYQTQEEFDDLYYSRILKYSQDFSSTTSSLAVVADSLFSNGRYGAAYWGGSSFFCLADQYLRAKHNQRFVDVMKAYAKCCRISDQSMSAVIRSFDDIIEDTYFTSLMARYLDGTSHDVIQEFLRTAPHGN